MKTQISLIVYIIVSSFFLLLDYGLAFPATYYVSPVGDNSKAGTYAQPWKTIQKAADSVSAGDTVIVKDGTYTASSGTNYVVRFTKSGTADNIITFKAENQYGAVIDGQSNSIPFGFQFYYDHLSYIRIEGFEFKGLSAFAITSGYTPSCNNIYIDKCKIYNIGKIVVNEFVGVGSYGRAGIYTGPLTHHWIIDSCIFYNIGRLEGGSYSDGSISHDYVHDHGYYAQGHHQTVINSIFYNMTSGWAIKIDGYNGPGLTGEEWSHKIVNNIFANDGNPSLTYGKGLITFYRNPSLANKYRNVTIDNNIFYNGMGNFAIAGTDCNKSYASQWPVDGYLHIQNNVTNEQYLVQDCWKSDITVYENNIDASTFPEIAGQDLGMTNPLNNVFTLTPDAFFLIDKASSDSAPILDISKQVRLDMGGLLPDIGPFEFLQNSILPPKGLEIVSAQ